MLRKCRLGSNQEVFDPLATPLISHPFTLLTSVVVVVVVVVCPPRMQPSGSVSGTAEGDNNACQAVCSDCCFTPVLCEELLDADGPVACWLWCCGRRGGDRQVAGQKTACQYCVHQDMMTD